MVLPIPVSKVLRRLLLPTMPPTMRYLPPTTDQAFEVLDAALSTPTRSKYRQRVEENYDMEGSPTFVAWKILHSLVYKPDKVVQTCSTPKKVSERINETPTSYSALNSSSVSSTTILKEILTYPTLETNVKTKKKNVKRALPNFVSRPESVHLLLDETHKKARQMAEKQQRLREKEKKKEERQWKAEDAKAQKPSGRKRKIKTKTFKKSRNSNERSGGESTLSRDEDICSICFEDYNLTDDENDPWIMCDECDSCMHMNCLPFEIELE